ncbi:MAG TPA: hypothetical protein DHN29_18780, partial [Cytophagales bacterium]|nr:hypothetical protein [Cytophagales bacterium]
NRVGIGTTAPGGQLDIRGTDDLTNDGVAVQLGVYDTTALAANVGAYLGLGGIYNSGGSQMTFGAIMGGKLNATNDNTAGYLAFYTREQGENMGTSGERMRIDN